MWNRAENQIGLVFIRHGETKANREGRYLGQTDEALSDEGRNALLFYQRQGIYPQIQALFTSPMRRCLETAAILYPNLQPTVIPEWQEMDFGQFEYKNYEELKYDRQYQEWIDSNGTLPFPEGEDRQAFTDRCKKGFQKMRCLLAPSENHDSEDCKEELRTQAAGLIVHGGTVMALLSSYGGGDYFDYHCPNGRGFCCRAKGMGDVRFREIKKL